jgi:predicted CoA-binding protein
VVTTSRSEINEFLSHKRIALVGVSRNNQEFGNMLYRDMRRLGYDAVPVNPSAETIEGDRCYARVQDIAPGVDAALLLTAPALNERVVADCAEAGIKWVWFYGVSDRSAENAKAITFCREHGIEVIPGFCPYMFLEGVHVGHRMHSWVARLVGMAPR